MSNYHLKQRQTLNSVRFVTHKGKSMKISTTTRPGQRGLMIPRPSITDHRSIPTASKTTKFRESKPVIQFKGEPPF